MPYIGRWAGVHTVWGYNVDMQSRFADDRIYLSRTPEERAPILNRLSRIEGQVRGLRQMVEEDRYSGDEIQQATAITAAIREVALLLIAQHLDIGIDCAADPARKSVAVADMVALMRNGLKL